MRANTDKNSTLKNNVCVFLHSLNTHTNTYLCFCRLLYSPGAIEWGSIEEQHYKSALYYYSQSCHMQHTYIRSLANKKVFFYTYSTSSIHILWTWKPIPKSVMSVTMIRKLNKSCAWPHLTYSQDIIHCFYRAVLLTANQSFL